MKLFSIALVGATLAMTGAVAAQENRAKQPADPSQYYGLYNNPAQAIAPSENDNDAFDHAGTRGREGLGAETSGPEGPGNVSD
jgi:hypothetical protein